jgi:hypothetical protein
LSYSAEFLLLPVFPRSAVAGVFHLELLLGDTDFPAQLPHCAGEGASVSILYWFLVM